MIYDLIIIGAGPAGTSAAVYAARQKLNMLVISKDVGGQVAEKSVDIENYPGFDKISGPDLSKHFADQLKSNNVEVALDEVLKIEKEGNKFIISTSHNQKFEALAVIIGTGADPRPLEAPGEKEFIGKGVSYCSLCDGPIFRDKTVAVIGGGNSGFESAVFLSNYVKKIYILEFSEVLRADQENQDLIKKNGKTEVITSAKVLKIEGEGFVKSLTYQDRKTNEEKKLEIDGIFVEVGRSPATAFAKGLVEFSERDEIIAQQETMQTKTPGLFAVGDCNQGKYKQIVTAAGEGAKAALAAYEYLQKTKK
jgi:thioredoxin-disulfide reductase